MLEADGFAGADGKAVQAALVAEGAIVEVVSLVLGTITGHDGTALEVDASVRDAFRRPCSGHPRCWRREAAGRGVRS